jgi:beta-1,3-galactosyltransferase 1/2/3/4/5/7/8
MHEVWSCPIWEVKEYTFCDLLFLPHGFARCYMKLLLYRDVRYYEPEHWKFGDAGNKYFRHATGQLYAISKDLATYISINKWGNSWSNHFSREHIFNPISCWQVTLFLLIQLYRHVLHKYINEDVSLGAWLLGLDVEHIDDRRLCCGTPPGQHLFLS